MAMPDSPESAADGREAARVRLTAQVECAG